MIFYASLAFVSLAMAAAQNPRIATNNGSVAVNIAAGKTFSVVCPAGAGRDRECAQACVGDNVQIRDGGCVPTAAFASQGLLAAQVTAHETEVSVPARATPHPPSLTRTLACSHSSAGEHAHNAEPLSTKSTKVKGASARLPAQGRPRACELHIRTRNRRWPPLGGLADARHGTNNRDVGTEGYRKLISPLPPIVAAA